MSGTAGFGTAAYGGPGWSPRAATHGSEMGSIWQGGLDCEWRGLRTVLLCRPGPAIVTNDPDAAQQLEPLDLNRAQAEHDALADVYRAEGVEVVSATGTTANAMFCADLSAMTPEGAILARPASIVRAGEEVAVAAALAAHGVPILRTLTGTATFEGADLIWIDRQTVLLGIGLRTNLAAARQIEAVLGEIGTSVIAVDMPFGTMHLMGMLRIADRDLAICWPRRTPHRAIEALRAAGYRTEFLPVDDDTQANRALNFVTLGPRRILMPAGNDRIRDWYAGLGLHVIETPTFELRKAAGAVGCLTGVIARDMGI